MWAVKGVYREGRIELLEPLPSVTSADLLMVVVPHPSNEEAVRYEFQKGSTEGTVMESRVDWDAPGDRKGTSPSSRVYSTALRKIVKPDADGFIRILAPKGLGGCFELLLLPAQHIKEDCDFFEGVDEQGIPYRVDEWTEEEFNVQSMRGAFKDDPTQAEDIFDV